MDEEVKENSKNNEGEALELLHKNFGSPNFQLQEEAMKGYGDSLLKLYFRSLDYIYRIASVVGIVAGFGFTALAHVDNMALFFLGEALLLGDMAFALWWIQSLHKKELSSVEDEYNKIRSHFSERNKLYKRIFDNTKKSNILDGKELLELQEKDEKLVEIVTAKGDEKNSNEQKTSTRLYLTIRIVFYLFLGGALSLLLSFGFDEISNWLAQIPS